MQAVLSNSTKTTSHVVCANEK